MMIPPSAVRAVEMRRQDQLAEAARFRLAAEAIRTRPEPPARSALLRVAGHGLIRLGCCLCGPLVVDRTRGVESA